MGRPSCRPERGDHRLSGTGDLANRATAPLRLAGSDLQTAGMKHDCGTWVDFAGDAGRYGSTPVSKEGSPMHAQIAGRLTGRTTKWLVLAFWIIAVGVGGTFASKLTDVQNNETSSWLPETAESTRALERLAPFADPDSIPTVVAYERKSGLTPADMAAAEAQAQEFATLDGVEGEVVGPIPARDGQAMQTVVTFNFGANGWMEMPATAEELRDIAQIEGVSTYVTGAGGQAADQSEVFEGIDGALLMAALSVVIVILLFTYRSPVLWLLPIISAVVALMVSQGLVYFLARDAGLTVNGQSQAILSILVIGAGTDYALLLVARYREELRRHRDRHEAMAFALHRATPAILASAATVVAGMLCLLFAEMNSTAGLGPVAAIGVGVTFLVMVTLLPALLVITGRWVFWPKRPAYGSPEPTQTGVWARIADRISVRPRTVWVTTSLLLAVACLGILRLDNWVWPRRTSTSPRSSPWRASRCWPSTGWPTPATPSRWSPTRGRRKPCARRWPASTEWDSRLIPSCRAESPTSRQRWTVTSRPSRPSTPSRRFATRCTTSPTRTPWSAAGRRSSSTR